MRWECWRDFSRWDRFWAARICGSPPPDRLSALREAFMATMKDKDFRAEAEKIGLEIDPATADDVQKLLEHFAKFPPALLAKARQAVGR